MGRPQTPIVSRASRARTPLVLLPEPLALALARVSPRAPHAHRRRVGVPAPAALARGALAALGRSPACSVPVCPERAGQRPHRVLRRALPHRGIAPAQTARTGAPGPRPARDPRPPPDGFRAASAPIRTKARARVACRQPTGGPARPRGD